MIVYRSLSRLGLGSGWMLDALSVNVNLCRLCACSVTKAPTKTISGGGLWFEYPSAYLSCNRVSKPPLLKQLQVRVTPSKSYHVTISLTG